MRGSEGYGLSWDAGYFPIVCASYRCFIESIRKGLSCSPTECRLTQDPVGVEGNRCLHEEVARISVAFRRNDQGQYGEWIGVSGNHSRKNWAVFI